MTTPNSSQNWSGQVFNQSAFAAFFSSGVASRADLNLKSGALGLVLPSRLSQNDWMLPADSSDASCVQNGRSAGAGVFVRNTVPPPAGAAVGAPAGAKPGLPGAGRPWDGAGIEAGMALTTRASPKTSMMIASFPGVSLKGRSSCERTATLTSFISASYTAIA